MSPNSNRRRQSGAVLLMVMLVIIVGASALLVTKASRNNRQILQLRLTEGALVRAKDALLNFAVSFPDRQIAGSIRLPCPDIDSGGGRIDGEAHTANCGATGVSVMGRLPWRTLGIAAPRDGSIECLWYVVSGEFKDAAAATAAMINPDSNGQLELFQAESAALIEGLTPAERPVALIIAPGSALGTQIRQALSRPGQQCSDDFSLAQYLDADSLSGVSNAVLNGAVGLDQFVKASGSAAGVNDRILSISRHELADAVYSRHDFTNRINALTGAIAKCVAAYGLSNPGGVADLRLPWPAPVALSDYRSDTQYDDVAGGPLSGRLADNVADSNIATSNTVARVLSDCDAVAVPEWTPGQLDMWQQWKDHFFYYVAESYTPAAAVPSNCINCLSVNGSGQFAAVVIFANRRLDALAQVRNAPPIDTDTKDSLANYLEARNLSSHPYVSGVADLESRAANDNFNDVLFCIDSALGVAGC